MITHQQFNRRDIVKFTGLGVATSILYVCGLLSGSAAHFRICDFAGQHWQPYLNAMVTD